MGDTRSQPRDSAYHDGRASHAGASPNTDLNGSIADDYRSYLPALAPEEDPMAEADVPDRHLRYRPSTDAGRLKPLPDTPNSSSHHHVDRSKQPVDGTGPGSTIRAVPSEPSRHHVSNAGFDNSVRSHRESSPYENHDLMKSGHPVGGSAKHDALAVKP